MSHHHDSDGLKMLGDLKTLAPVEFGGFLALDTEIAETALITAALRAGAAVTHGALALKLYDQAKGDLR